MGSKQLTPKQHLFVKEYLVDYNATQAAIRAGYSKATAGEIGRQLLEKPWVREVVDAETAERAKRLDITADKVLQELAAVGFAKLGDFVDIEPTGIRIKSGSDVDTRVLAEVTERITKEGTTVSIKLHDKISALDKLGRHLGLFKDKVEVTGENGGPLKVDYHTIIREEAQKVLHGAPKTVEAVNQQFPLPPPPGK